MKIVTWNVNGIRSVQRKGALDWVYSSGADFVCLQEVKIAKEQFDEFDFPDNIFINHNLGVKKGYSGVVVISKEKPTSVVKEIGHERLDSEGRYLELHFDGYVVINVYIPHGGRQKENLEYKLDAYEKLFERIEELEKSVDVYIAGDFNIAHTDLDLARPDQNRDNIMFTQEERDVITKFIGFGYVDCLRHKHPEEDGLYTWWPYAFNARERNMEWRIDYVFIQEKKLADLVSADTMPEKMGSDHGPLEIEVR